MKSTMTILREERDKFRLLYKVSQIVGITCVAAVLIVAILKLNGSL